MSCGEPQRIRHIEKERLTRADATSVLSHGGDEADGALVVLCAVTFAIDWRWSRSGKIHCFTPARRRALRAADSERGQRSSPVRAFVSLKNNRLREEAAVFGAKPGKREAPSPAASAACAAKLASRPDRT